MARKAKNKASSKLSWLPDRAHLARATTTTTTIVLFLALSIGLLVGRGALQARATEVVREPVQVLFEWPPLARPAGAPPASSQTPQTWLDVQTQHQLVAMAREHLTADPFDGVSLSRARDALAATGWFATGPVLRRESAGVVRVEGAWRVPFAVVRAGTSDILVTRRGERLDKTYPAGKSGLPLVVGVRYPAPIRLGEAWAGTDIHAGLGLLATLQARAWFKEVAAVDVSAGRELMILTTSGGRIRWGGPVESPLPGEQPTAVKLRHLDNLVVTTGRLDGGNTAVVNITGANVFAQPEVESGR